jgi:signal transduction histidine kinase/CheY-like chemotaxis protein/HPt (histidine-containing phosphotransfer) domain-containing protein
MKSIFSKRISVFFWRVNSLLEKFTNSFLPKDLTKRYLLGLGSVAFLVMMAQFFEQLTIQQQYKFFSTIRSIDQQINQSQKIAIAIESSRTQKENEHDTLSIIRSTYDKLAIEHLNLHKKCDSPEIGDWITDTRKFNTNALDDSLKSLYKSIFSQNVSKNFRANFDNILINEKSYRSNLKNIVNFYENKIETTINYLQILSLAFALLTTLLLGFVALYVIRPAVRLLYEALDARSKFLSRMGNEIRNPMNSIIGMSRLLETSELTAQQRSYVNTLASSSGSLMTLLNKLIDYSRISTGKVLVEYCDIDLLNTVQECIDIVSYKAAHKNLEIFLDISADTPQRVTTDPLLLQQIILNLLESAIEFTSYGKVNLSIWKDNGLDMHKLNFSVSDTGSGISKEKLDAIFECFHQDKPWNLKRFGSEGIGLGICSELVALAGGRIEVESEIGKGSNFHFFLPINNFSQEIFQDIFSDKALKNKKVFLMESIEERRVKISSYLSDYGGEVFTPIGIENDRECLLKYFQETEFDSYIINYEDYPASIELLIQAQEFHEQNFLGKVIILAKPTLSSSKITRLNSVGVKNFCYLPIKPVEFLRAVDLVLARKNVSIKKTATDLLLRFKIGKKISALIVDDSKDNQFLLKNYIQKHCSHIDVANNGIEALEMFKHDIYDIIFMDLAMPELDGYSAAKEMRAWEIKHNRMAAPIIAVSAHTSQEEQKNCSDCGFTSHIAKPIDLAEFQHLLVRHFGSGSESTADITQTEEKMWHLKLKEYLPNYYRQRESDVDHLHKALAIQDWEKIASIGHKIKGSAATYGFPELGNAGAELEESVAEKNFVKTKQKIEFLEGWLKNNLQIKSNPHAEK